MKSNKEINASATRESVEALLDEIERLNVEIYRLRQENIEYKNYSLLLDRMLQEI